MKWFAAFLLILALTRTALAHPGGDGGQQQQWTPPHGEQAVQLVASRLDCLRQKPDQKGGLLAVFREKAQRLGGPDQVEERLADIARILDRALSMGDAEYQAERQQMARRIWYDLSLER